MCETSYFTLPLILHLGCEKLQEALSLSVGDKDSNVLCLCNQKPCPALPLPQLTVFSQGCVLQVCISGTLDSWTHCTALDHHVIVGALYWSMWERC